MEGEPVSRFGDAVKMFTRDLPVTQGHNRWLDTDRTYSKKAIRFVAQQLLWTGKTDRTGRFSPSGISGCQKRLLLQWAGVSHEKENHSSDLMNAGTWSHLKWQAEGLTEGWLEEGEITGADATSSLCGTMDGRLSDGSGFEFKSTNSIYYGRVKLNDEPFPDHVDQIHAYMRIHNINLFSVVYENRDTADFLELRVKKDAEVEKRIDERVHALTKHTRDRTVPEMLPDCVKETGLIYRRCPYRYVCPHITAL
jgi:hypothetical protein